MITELKQHIVGSIKRIGYGAYSDAFKVYYDLENCPNLDHPQSIAKLARCDKCNLVYKQSDFIVIKEIQFTDKYEKYDFDLECKFHRQAFAYMPDLIVKLYDSYTHNYPINPDDVLQETKYGIQETKPLPAALPFPLSTNQIQYGYLMLEYMNYKDLYLNCVLAKKTDKWLHALNIKGLILICLVIIYNLHCKLHICHGDIRDTNIFLRYVGPDYKQQITIDIPFTPNSTGSVACELRETPVQKHIIVETGGFHIKLGDFGLADKLVGGIKSFIFRDYEILDNIYQSRNHWSWMVPDATEYDKIINFLRKEFIYPINERMVFNNISIENVKNRRDFWFIKHLASEHSMFLYKYPELLLKKYIARFYS